MSPTLVEVIPPETPCAPAAGAHAPALIVGLRWLYDTEQPATAIIDHRGRRLRSAGGRTVRFTPVGWQGRAVVVLIPTADAHGRRRPVSAGELGHSPRRCAISAKRWWPPGAGRCAAW